MEEAMRLFYEMYEEIPRQGPGDNNSTRRAYNMVAPFLKKPCILDVGCGNGMQTLELASISGGSIIGLDNHLPFLSNLAKGIAEKGMSASIGIREGSMFELPFDEGTFDLIWSEGAIYIIGFEKGLAEWGRFLRPGGYLAVTELSWLCNSPPAEPLEYWQNEYPGIQSVEGNIGIIKKQGYNHIGHFTLPESSWWVNHYDQIIERLKFLRKKYKDNSVAQEIYEATEVEIDLYRRHSDSYGYVFYVMQKNR